MIEATRMHIVHAVRSLGNAPVLRRFCLRRRINASCAGGKFDGRALRRNLFSLLAFAAMMAAAQADGSTNRFSFTGPEIFPVDNQIGHLRAADLDGDGLQDLIVVNNFRSKINLLYNQTSKTNQAEAKTPVKRELNQLPPDARFRIESIASEKRISSLVVADLNGDNRPDVAYYGEPKELVVQFNQGTNGWSAPKRWPLDDGLLDQNGLASG